MSPSAGLLAPPRHLRLQRPAPALCPITALAFYRFHGIGELFILAAEDSWLSVYAAAGPLPVSAGNFNASGHHCHGRLLVFAEQSIQGLRVGDEDGGIDSSYSGDVLIWGGQSVALVSAAQMKALLLQQREGSEIKLQQQAQQTGGGPRETRAHDRIYDALLLPSEDSSSDAGGRIGALITAHNEVVPFFVMEEKAEESNTAKAGPVVILEHPISFSRPVLYSARLTWTAGSGLVGRRRLLVAAGTVFGEIVVWTCRLPLLPTDRRKDEGGSFGGSNSYSPDIQMLGTFTGHEGSIFDVALSPEFCLLPPHKDDGDSSASLETRIRLLVSCSDDRTIRVWPLVLGREEEEGQLGTVPTPLEQRETGYQNTFTDARDREIEYRLQQQQQQQQKQNHSTSPSALSASSPALAVVMAHASRIWHVHFGAVARKVSALTSALPGIFLYSFGEDAAVQEWFLQVDWTCPSVAAAAEEGAASSPASLKGSLHHCRTLENHVGKNLWAAAVFLPSFKEQGQSEGLDSERPLVATSGGDGQICLFHGGNNGEMAGPKSGGGDLIGDSPFSSSNIVTCVLPSRTTLSKHEPSTSEESLQPIEAVAVADANHENYSGPAGADDDYVAALSEAISLPTKKGSQKRLREELFNSYAFLSETQILAVTTHGRLLLGSIDHHADNSTTAGTRSTSAWVEVSGVPEEAVMALQDYNVVRSPRGGGGGGMATAGGCAEGLAVIGNARGRLFLYSIVAGLQELSTLLPGKVEEMLFLPAGASAVVAADPEQSTATDSITATRLQLVASVLFSDQATVIDLELDTARGTILSERYRAMPLPRRTPSSPSPSSVTAASRCGDYIAVGSRHGQICLYTEVADTDGCRRLQMQAQTQTRTRDAILSIVPLPPPRRHSRDEDGGGGGDYSPSFVVTARDGTYRIYEVELMPPETSVGSSGNAVAPFLCLRHETALPFGPIVRDAWFVHVPDHEAAAAVDPPELILCGFRSTKFVVWNETRQQELATVDCGGTHRTYTFMVPSFCGSEPGRLRFAFTRNSGLHVFAQNASVTVRAKAGGHGREIKGVSASTSGTYVATGGEDTIVRIWTGNGGSGGSCGSGSVEDSHRRCLAVLKLHNTGLHSLAWLGDHRLLSAAGSEELFVWRVARLDSAYEGLAVICESAYPAAQSSDKTLRITAMDASYESEPGEQGQDGGSSSDGRSAHVTLALSNSVIKTYRYTPPGTWQLLAQGRYTGACPTQLRHLHMRENGDLSVLAAFADGSLSVWRATLTATATATDTKPATYTLVPTAAAPVHRNAIKCFSLSRVWKTPTRSWLAVLTGGDDNAIAVTQLSWSSDPGPNPDSYDLHKTFRVSSAHAAAVAGIQIVAEAGGEDDDNENDNDNDSDGSKSKSLLAVSCSNDQRVKAWRVLLPEPQPRRSSRHGHKGRTRIQLLENSYSAIADAAGLEGIRGPDGKISSALVVGMGMESWRIIKA